MNIMDRKSFIKFLYEFYNGITLDKVEWFLRTYCIERGKSDINVINKFIAYVIMSDSYEYVQYAIQWYRIKFNVRELSITLNNKDKKIIYIF